MRKFKLKKTFRVHEMFFTPGGQQLLLFTGVEASGIDTALWLNHSNGEVARTESFLVDCMAISPDHSRLVGGRHAYNPDNLPNCLQWSNPLQLPSLQRQIDWTAIEFGAIWTTRTSAITVDSLAISPDGDRLLVAFGARRGTSNNPVWHHFLSECHISGRKTPTTIEVETQFVGLRFAPDGASWIAVRRNDDRPDIGLFTGFNRAPLAQFRTRLWPGKTSFSPDGRYLAIARHKSVLLLTANELTQTAEFGEHEKVVKDLAFSPDSNRLISVSNDGTIRVWDVAARQLISKFKWDIGAVSAVAFAPDGLTCAAAGTRGQIVIWDME